ncbi:MAG: lysophospholipid acyltransferase family protein [Pseudomonadota bacterium]
MKLLLSILAALPERVAYFVADVLYLLAFYLFRYRRATVRENLLHAFPEKTDEERDAIEKASYKHLLSLLMEIIRSTKMSEEEFNDRVRFSNLDLMETATEGYEKQVIILLIHQGNWEWMLHGAMAQMPVSVDPVYKKLHNEFWQEYMLSARSRFGASPMALDQVGREVLRGRKKKRLIVMLADQAGPRDGGFWTDFLNRPASFYRGAEKLAQALKVRVLFAQCRRVERGRYEVEFHEFDDGSPMEEERLLENYVRFAETVIAQQPETYLWTNRRWKKKPPKVESEGVS